MESIVQDPVELEKARKIGQLAVIGSKVSPTDIVTDALHEISKHYVLIPKEESTIKKP